MPLPADFWGPTYGIAEPTILSESDIRQWEQRHGVILPKHLAAALLIQNGGYVHGSSIVIFPLADFVPLTGPHAIPLWDEEPEFGEPSRLIMFAMLDGSGASLILNYNTPNQPRIIHLWHDLGDELRDEGIGTFDDLVARR